MKINVYVLGIFVGLSLLFGLWFTYRLGYTSLQSYDEAWYGSVARDVTQNSNPLILTYNGQVFTDHPPLVIWLMAGSYSLLGVNEFSSRIVAAILGALAIGLMYLIGRQLFSSKVGVIAAAMLGSSLWFWLRARSGNLDVPFVYLYLQSIWLLMLTRKWPKCLPLLGLSVGSLLLSKTLVGWSILPIIGYELWSQRASLKKSGRLLGVSGLALALVVLPWYVINQVLDADFLRHHFIEIGLRGRTGVDFHQWSTTLLYLQSGIGKWFKVVLLGGVLSVIYAFLNKEYLKKVKLVWVWLAVVGLPFLSSARTEVWHLLPLYPPLMLLAASSFEELTEWIGQKVAKHTGWIRKMLVGILMVSALLLAGYQITQFWQLVVPAQVSVSSEADISQQAGRYTQNIQLKEVFLPTAVFYSQAQVQPLGFKPQAYQEMVAGLTQTTEVFIIPKTDVKQLQQDQIAFKVLAENEQYVVIQGRSK